MRRRLALTLSGLAIMVGAVVGHTSGAGAVEGKQLRIAKFALSPTASTGMIPLNRKIKSFEEESFEFVNEPYEYTQAGGHPWAFTTIVELSSEKDKNGSLLPTQEPRDIVADLPPGLIGNPMAVPRCSLGELVNEGECPPSTQVGFYKVVWLGGKEFLGPIVDIVPEAGQSAEFGLENTARVNSVLTGHLVRTAEGYRLAVDSNGIPVVQLVRAELTFWGVPADHGHDAMRGLFCAVSNPGRPLSFCHYNTVAIQGKRSNYNEGEQSGVAPVPFLSMPTDCTAGPETATVLADSWTAPARVGLNGQYEGYAEAQATLPGVTGCDLLSFKPGIEVLPDTLLADEPVGLDVNVSVPQNERPQTDATPHLRDAVVTLPEGLSISPGIVNGIKACDESGPEGIDFTGPESEEPGLNGELQLAPGHCPDASIVGTAEAITPLLPVPVKGHVYLARPGCGGQGQRACTEADALDGNLYRLYLELGGSGELADTGVHIKVPGYVQADPATGQLTTKFLENPQTPFSELKVSLNGGPRAPLDNPPTCGPAVTTADFTPWSAPGVTPQGLTVLGTPDATPSWLFDVEGCSAPPPFDPGFVAGSVTPQAGQFSSFTLNLSRQDREQYVKGIQLHTPPGLLAMLSSVPPCGEPQADDGTCSEASKIGTTRVASGAGSHPFEIEGDVYLTGPYEGAPFGLSVVTHVVAGPFNLGVVVVRARIDVDPEDSTAIVTVETSGPHALPQIVFGVPLRLQRVTVDIDRPGFMLNPTNCEALRVSAQISGDQDAVANVSSPFAVGGCKSLAFKPKFTASTNGHTSRATGASLDTKLSYPRGALGEDANIARVKVSLPKQLPSRLTTLQKACPAETFANDPAACPRASIVGIARTSTPILATTLEGPVYFVSHGGEKFPSLIVVLQGDGIRVDLTGSTFIDRKGITSSAFNTVPDVPVNSFELYLPQGKDSALAANGKLCAAQNRLVMPTEFVAQNGAIVRQHTKIAVRGCGPTRVKASRHGRAGRGHRPRRARGAGSRRGNSGRGGKA
jgi:hypothetical protein